MLILAAVLHSDQGCGVGGKISDSNSDLSKISGFPKFPTPTFPKSSTPTP